MPFDAIWRSIRERCESLDPDAVLLTPASERAFVVDRTDDDRIVVRFREGGDRTLWRDQFRVLVDRVGEEPLPFDSLPPGVGPYVAVLSLAPEFAIDDGALRRVDEAEEGGTESALLRSQWDVRRPPEQVHDDALLVADWLERRDATDVGSLAERDLVDLYVLLSDVQWGADDVRREVGDELLDHVGPEGRLHGQFGTVTRTRRERRQLKDEDEILDRLDEADVPREWVLGVDDDKLDVVVAATDVDEADVYDVTEQYYVQKTDVESEAKRERLRGLRDRLAGVDDEEADRLREEIDALEDRIDDVLAAG